MEGEPNKNQKEQAVMIIGEMKQQAAVMGANDFEIPALDNLLIALNQGEITPEEAIAEAHKIVNRKTDYH
jgi:predicted RNA-binding protein associated with RNAse of E/G family